jgi:uncharacterized protein (DUF1501 family)
LAIEMERLRHQSTIGNRQSAIGNRKDHMTFDRRIFLKSTGLSLVAGGLLPNVFVRMAEAGTPTSASRHVLVAIFQRGAVDGLNMLVP